MSNHLHAILNLMQHCSDEELIEIAKCARTMAGELFLSWWHEPYSRLIHSPVNNPDNTKEKPCTSTKQL